MSSTSTSTNSTSTATTLQPDVEAPLSLFGLTRLHPREELIVNPVRWSGLHTELLNFHFHGPYPEPPPPASVAAITEAEYSEERSGTRHLKHFFDYYYKPVFREQGIWELITTDATPLVIYDISLTLSMGETVLKNLNCMAFYLEESIIGRKVHKLPVAALVDQGRITQLRKHYLGLSRCKQWKYWNRPMCNVYQKKWKKITPPNPMHDPFITALLIGLAQKKRRYLREIGSPEEARTGKLYSQVVHTYNCRGPCKQKSEASYNGWLYLYQADIPSTLLDMFEQPNVAPPERPHIDIRITKVTYYPLATLRARLLELILPGTAAATAAAEAATAHMVATSVPSIVITQADTVQPMIDPAAVQMQQAMDQAAMDQAANQAAMDQAANQAAMDQAAAVTAQMQQTQAAMAPPMWVHPAVRPTYANQIAQKRKFEDGHNDQPSQRWAPRAFLSPVNQFY